MIEQIEISSLDLRYEGYRLKSRIAEKALLASIIEHGVRDPLQGVDLGDGIRILLNGFKRYRCAKKLNISIVPYRSFGSDEPLGIIKLIRISNSGTGKTKLTICKMFMAYAMMISPVSLKRVNHG
jgi:hypothetical protein